MMTPARVRCPPVTNKQRAVEQFPLHERDQRLQQMMTPERVRCPPAFPQFPASNCRALSSARGRPTFATDDDSRESTMPSGFLPVSSSELIPVTSIELSALSSARGIPTFATDDDTRESTMPSGFSPVTNKQRAVEQFPLHERDQRLQQMMTPERVRCPPAFPPVAIEKLSGIFLCTSETNICNR
jgi:hypothetical protein